ncbi:enoyl-CoA hydratase-related protein [Cryobacterium tagatosivorans]|uniref:Enoyl-CoA hydratase n=1 Tax=Cryobacterium tagatosivorans TaxID=1259199 RepID=A0A4R8UIG7_9MICO|nr:enoyl-CoA hydratase-related protein [Cryobacterium tagatosivorans]TFB54202.1 hypothetical protein E3O23_03835 [Cryobacterium tagatosivorans]
MSTTDTEEPLVLVEPHGDVVVLRLNRPAKMNALSLALEQHLLDAVRSDVVSAARAIVFAGSARAFSAGTDTH